jgi:predicted small metal-binding protein
MEMKVNCPRKGCNYQADVDAAKDAMEDLQMHLKEVHGIDEVPDDMKEMLEGKIKTGSRSRK